MYKILVICSLVAASAATSIYGAEPQPVPAFPPQPFAYEYGVKDPETNTNFQKNEHQDETGKVQGSYSVSLPDGRIQTVEYTADAVNGFVADVTYQGEAQYPEEPAPSSPSKAQPQFYYVR